MSLKVGDKLVVIEASNGTYRLRNENDGSKVAVQIVPPPSTPEGIWFSNPTPPPRR